MAAVRCAARRLGGSLLHRWQTQAAVAPSSIMRSRGLHSEIPSELAREIQQKTLELGNLASKTAHTQAELCELLRKAGVANDPKSILSLQQVVPEPEPTLWSRCMDFATSASIALEIVAKVTFLAGITAWWVVVIRENGIKPNLFTRKNTGEAKIED